MQIKNINLEKTKSDLIGEQLKRQIAEKVRTPKTSCFCWE